MAPASCHRPQRTIPSASRIAQERPHYAKATRRRTHTGCSLRPVTTTKLGRRASEPSWQQARDCPLRGVSATTGEVTAVGYIAFSPESVAHAGSCESGEPCRLKSEGIGSAARARGAATEVKRMGDGDDRRSSYKGASACSQQRLNPARRDAASRAATPLRTTACASDYYQEPGANSSRRADVSKFRTCRPVSSPDSIAT